jgi:molecular chaperone DnaK (HSP70)
VSTNLDQSEVERMVRDAEQHAAEDRRRREEIDARITLSFKVRSSSALGRSPSGSSAGPRAT